MKKRLLVLILSLALFSSGIGEALARGGGGGKGSYRSSGSRSSGYKSATSRSTCRSASPVRVQGYTKRNGTYVKPHYRTAPNATKSDNWSTKGNINPYTGKAGTKNP